MALSGANLVHLKKGVPDKKLEIISDDVTIGSDLRCTVRIHKADVERKHCTIKRNGSKVILNNCSQSTNILVNDKLVLSDIELKDNDVLSVSNRKFLWSFNASNFKNKYRRITTFSNRGRNKTNQKIDGRERKSLPLSAYLPISAESPEKQIAIVKPLQSAPVEDVFLMEAAGSYNSSVIGGQNVVSKNLVQKNSNTLNLIKKTPRKSTGARSSRSKILEKLSHSAPKTRDGNKMRMSQRHSLAAVVQTIKDSIKIVNTNIKRNKPMKKATRKSISQNKIVAKTAVKRKFSEEEVINLNNKKRKLNSPVIDAKKKAALMVLKTGEQNHIKPAKSYPQHQYALKVPNSFSFGPVASNFGTGSEKTDKKNNSINEIKENAIGTEEGTHNCEVKSSLLENNKKTLRRSSMRCNTSKTENDNIESREQNIVASKNKDCMRKSSIQSGLIEPAFKQSLKYFDKRKSYCTDVATKIKRTNKMLNRSLDSQDSQSSAIDIKSAINNFSEIDEKSMHSTKKDGSFAIDNTEDSILKPSLIEQSTLLGSEGEINDHLPDTSSKIIKLKSAPIVVEPTIQNNSLSRKSIRRSIRASPAKDLIKDRNNATNAKKNVQKEISQSPTYSLENSKTESSFVSDEDNVNTGSKSIFYLDNSVTENSTVDPQFNESLENINSNFCKKRFVNSQNKNGKTPRKSGLFNRSLKKIAEEVSTQSDVLEEAVGKNKIRLSMKRTSLRNSIKKVNTNESEILVDLNMSGPQSESLILEDSSLNDTVFLNSSQEIYNSTSQLNISIQSTEETNANVSKAQNASIQISAAENDLIFEGSENSKIPSKVAEMSLRISSLQENNVEVHNDLNKSEIVMKTKTKRASSVNTKSLNNSSITNLLPEDNVNISHTDNEFNINESKSNSKRSSVLNRKSLRNSVTIKTTEEINASDDLTVEFDHHNQSDYLYPKTKEETLCKSMKVQDNVKSPVKRFSLKSVHGVQELGINNDHINQINENLNIASSVKQKRLSNYIIDSVQEPSDIELSQSDIELSTHEIHLDDAPIFDSEHRDENNLKDSGLHNNSRLEKYSNNSFKTQKRNSARIFNTRKSLSALTSGKSLCNSDVLINTSLPCPSLKTSDQLHDGLLNKIQKSHLSMSNNTFSSSDSLSHMTNMNEKLIEDNTNSIKRNSLRVSNVNSYVNQLDGKLNTSEHLLKDLNQTLMESSPLQTKSVNNSINLDQNATNVQGDEIVVVNESILSDKSMLDTAEQIIDYTDETLSKYNVSYPEDDAETTSRKSLRSGSRAASAVKHILLNPINQNVSMNHKTRRISLQFLPSKNPQYQKQKLNASLPFKLNSRKSKLLNQSLNNGLKMNTNERKSESMTTLSDIENQLENTNTTLPDILSETSLTSELCQHTSLNNSNPANYESLQAEEIEPSLRLDQETKINISSNRIISDRSHIENIVNNAEFCEMSANTSFQLLKINNSKNRFSKRKSLEAGLVEDSIKLLRESRTSDVLNDMQNVLINKSGIQMKDALESSNKSNVNSRRSSRISNASVDKKSMLLESTNNLTQDQPSCLSYSTHSVVDENFVPENASKTKSFDMSVNLISVEKKPISNNLRKSEIPIRRVGRNNKLSHNLTLPARGNIQIGTNMCSTPIVNKICILPKSVVSQSKSMQNSIINDIENISFIEKEVTPEANNSNSLLSGVNYESTPVSTMKLKRNNVEESNINCLETADSQASKPNDENDDESITPKTSIKIIPDVAKKLHSTAKKSISRRTLNTEKTVHPLSIIINSNVSLNDLQKSEDNIFKDDITNLEKSDISKKRSCSKVTFQDVSSRNVDNIHHLSKSPKNDLTNVSGIKHLFRQQGNVQSPKNDLTTVVGLRRMSDERKHVSPKNNLTNISGVKYLLSPSNSSQITLKEMSLGNVSQIDVAESSFGKHSSTPYVEVCNKSQKCIKPKNATMTWGKRRCSLGKMKPMVRGRRLYSETDIYMRNSNDSAISYDNTQIINEVSHPAITEPLIDSSKPFKRIIDPVFAKLSAKKLRRKNFGKSSKAGNEKLKKSKLTTIDCQNDHIIDKCAVLLTPLKNVENYLVACDSLVNVQHLETMEQEEDILSINNENRNETINGEDKSHATYTSDKSVRRGLRNKGNQRGNDNSNMKHENNIEETEQPIKRSSEKKQSNKEETDNKAFDTFEAQSSTINNEIEQEVSAGVTRVLRRKTTKTNKKENKTPVKRNRKRKQNDAVINSDSNQQNEDAKIEKGEKQNIATEREERTHNNKGKSEINNSGDMQSESLNMETNENFVKDVKKLGKGKNTMQVNDNDKVCTPDIGKNSMKNFKDEVLNKVESLEVEVIPKRNTRNAKKMVANNIKVKNQVKESTEDDATSSSAMDIKNGKENDNSFTQEADEIPKRSTRRTKKSTRQCDTLIIKGKEQKVIDANLKQELNKEKSKTTDVNKDATNVEHKDINTSERNAPTRKTKRGITNLENTPVVVHSQDVDNMSQTETLAEKTATRSRKGKADSNDNLQEAKTTENGDTSTKRSRRGKVKEQNFDEAQTKKTLTKQTRSKTIINEETDEMPREQAIVTPAKKQTKINTIYKEEDEGQELLEKNEIIKETSKRNLRKRKHQNITETDKTGKEDHKMNETDQKMAENVSKEVVENESNIKVSDQANKKIPVVKGSRRGKQNKAIDEENEKHEIEKQIKENSKSSTKKVKQVQSENTKAIDNQSDRQEHNQNEVLPRKRTRRGNQKKEEEEEDEHEIKPIPQKRSARLKSSSNKSEENQHEAESKPKRNLTKVAQKDIIDNDSANKVPTRNTRRKVQKK